MRIPNQILDYYGKTHAAFLHAKGEHATDILIEKMDCQNNEKILEIGFGTGATLVRLLSKYKDAAFYGVEVSPIMYRKATSRMRFCGVRKHVHIQLIKNPSMLPFPDNFFDKVYLESVLAIQEGQKISLLLAEIHRVLKPAGKLFLNETIWLNTVSQREIAAINEICKAEFGIIQANGLYPYPENWRSLLKESNFEVLSMESIDEMEEVPMDREPFIVRHLSRIFTLWGRIKAKFNPGLRNEFHSYEDLMNSLSSNKKYVDGKIIICNSCRPS
jgi:ubiquinone/menaquinone biosynthesis C-methylase UbiE